MIKLYKKFIIKVLNRCPECKKKLTRSLEGIPKCEKHGILLV